MTDQALTEFVDRAMTTAAKAAAQYLRAHDLRVEPEVMLACLRSHVRARIESGLIAARRANEAGMSGWATTAFTVELIQAGIDAAKEAGLPPAAHAIRLQERAQEAAAQAAGA